MNIKKLLKNKPFCNELHFFLFSIILMALTINYPFFIIFLILYLIFIFRKTKIFIPIFITTLIFSGSYYIKSTVYDKNNEIDCNKEFLVLDVKENYIVIKQDIKIIGYIKGSNIKPGDIIICDLEPESFDSKSYDGDFDSRLYYQSKGISYKGNIKNFKVVGQSLTIGSLRHRALNYYESRLNAKTFSYLKAIIFGESNLDDEINDAYKSLYISHILTISGMHIMFLYKILVMFFNKVFKIEGSVVSTFLIFIYVLFLEFPISALRAFMFLFIGLLNKVGYIKYTKLDILSLSCTFMLIINPYLMYQVGFILTYLVSFILLFIKEFTTECTKIKTNFLNSLICVLITLPIIINLNNSISILGFLFSVMISLFLPEILLSMMVIILIIPNPIFEYIFIGLDYILILLSNHSLTIKFPYISIYLIVIYYLIFVLFLISLVKKRNVYRYTILLVLFMIFVKSIVFLNPNYKVTFIDVGQGDSALIQCPNNKANILIDSYNNLDYLKSLGIDNIDYIFLSHFDNDHMGSITDVVEEFNVKRIYCSYYSDKSKIDCKIINYLYPLKAFDELSIEGIKIDVLGPCNDYQNENANSLVLKIFINNYSFLFTGDIDIEVEKDMINNLENKLKSDVLKVPHHGSNTSSSIEFIDKVHPTYSVISVSEYNYYGLPNKEIVERLDLISDLYLTKTNGNISFVINENEIKIKTYKNAYSD